MNHDISICEAFRNGHEPAFTAVYHQYVKELLYYANKFMRDDDLANGCVADAFAALWEKKHTMTDEGHIKGFLITTIKNKCLNSLDKIARGAGQEISTLPEAFDDRQAEAILLESEVMNVLVRLFTRLSPAQRAVARLAWIEGQSNEEIAECLGKSVEHIRVVLSQIKQRLKKDLDRFLLGLILFLMAFHIWQYSFGLFILVKNIFSFH